MGFSINWFGGVGTIPSFADDQSLGSEPAGRLESGAVAPFNKFDGRARI
ncbi:hypothetical protein [Piscinibacter sakaiensis]